MACGLDAWPCASETSRLALFLAQGPELVGPEVAVVLDPVVDGAEALWLDAGGAVALSLSANPFARLRATYAIPTHGHRIEVAAAVGRGASRGHRRHSARRQAVHAEHVSLPVRRSSCRSRPQLHPR